MKQSSLKPCLNKIEDSYELFIFLKKQNLLEGASLYWWPSKNDFDVLIGAILTQNTKWENAEKSLKNLSILNYDSLETLANADLETLIIAITPSGFKNQKSIRIKKLCLNIIETFGSFENFQKQASRAWLLEQKGIGPETADAVMCYCLHRNEMVVDAYANRLLKKFDYDFDCYEDLKYWLEYGINENFDKISKIYPYEIDLNTVYCRFHGKIVEYMKKNK